MNKVGEKVLTKKQTKPSISTGAFTLIELLVVIAIIALLISILVPSLSRAKDLAKELTCLANQRIIGMAVRYYEMDNNGFLPPEPLGDSDLHTIAPYLDRAMNEPLSTDKKHKPKCLFCPCDEDPYPTPFHRWPITSYFTNGAATNLAMGGGKRISLGLFGGSCKIERVKPAGECMMIGETTNWAKIADLDHPRAVQAMIDAGVRQGAIRNAMRDFHHRATSGFFHRGKMNIYFADGHGASVTGKDVSALPESQWPTGAKNGATFFPSLSLPTADECPQFWGMPYDK